MENFKRIPQHIGVIPDGNRRWAVENGFQKEDGYHHGVWPGFQLYEMMLEYGIKEATFYGFTKDNNKREKSSVLLLRKPVLMPLKSYQGEMRICWL